MQLRESVDFSAVEPHQAAIHRRLENWARSCRGHRRMSAVSAGFSMASSGWARGDEPPPVSVPINFSDATVIAKGVIALPDKHRAAIQWSYVKPTHPRQVAQSLAVSLQGLADLVREGRQMLIVRKV